MRGNLLVGQKSGYNAAIMSLAPPRSLYFQINFGWGLHEQLGDGLRVAKVWRKKPDNWPERRQRPGRTDLHKWLLLPLHCIPPHWGHPHPLQVCISASLCLNWKNPFSVCSPNSCCAISNNKHCTCFYSFCFCEQCMFFWGQSSREKIASSV